MFLYLDLLLCKWNHELFISTFLIFTVSVAVFLGMEPPFTIPRQHSKQVGINC